MNGLVDGAKHARSPTRTFACTKATIARLTFGYGARHLTGGAVLEMQGGSACISKRRARHSWSPANRTLAFPCIRVHLRARTLARVSFLTEVLPLGYRCTSTMASSTRSRSAPRTTPKTEGEDNFLFWTHPTHRPSRPRRDARLISFSSVLLDLVGTGARARSSIASTSSTRRAPPFVVLDNGQPPRAFVIWWRFVEDGPDTPCHAFTRSRKRHISRVSWSASVLLDAVVTAGRARLSFGVDFVDLVPNTPSVLFNVPRTANRARLSPSVNCVDVLLDIPDARVMGCHGRGHPPTFLVWRRFVEDVLLTIPLLVLHNAQPLRVSLSAAVFCDAVGAAAHAPLPRSVDCVDVILDTTRRDIPLSSGLMDLAGAAAHAPLSRSVDCVDALLDTHATLFVVLDNELPLTLALRHGC
ncbi:hypothetical protein DFH06DRAFT_1488904 [Mycena polygramma]|nr:hypothetical protein DFH06DRAFT_1488904 [Mycena polygramma]